VHLGFRHKVTQKDIEEELIQGVSAILSRDNPRPLTSETPLMELGMDSLGLIEIFVFIEKRFNLQLLDSGITKEDMGSIKSLASYIGTRV
jgi:acyl carrier protein